MDIDSLKHYIKDLLTFMQYLRVWPFEKSFPVYKALQLTVIVGIFLATNSLLIIAEISAAVINFDMQRFAACIGPLGLHATGLLKWVFCIRKRNEIVRLFSKLNQCHLLCTHITNDEKGNVKYNNRMKQASSELHFFMYTWSILCIYGVLHWCLNPLFIQFVIGPAKQDVLNLTSSTKNTLPFIGWYPWTIATISGYLSTYILQVLGGLAAAFGIVSYDVLYVSILIIVCAQFQYLNESLSTEDCTSVRKRDKTFDLQTKLKNCVAHHAEVTKLVNDLEVLVNPVMFAQCIETLTVICLLSFQASTIKITIDMECMMTLWSMMEYFIAASVQLYAFCFYATQIRYLVADFAYSCGWEKGEDTGNDKSQEGQLLNLRSTKCLIEMIMLRAQKPLVLTGGPFYELSLETFKAIIGMGISNSVMLRQLSE